MAVMTFTGWKITSKRPLDDPAPFNGDALAVWRTRSNIGSSAQGKAHTLKHTGLSALGADFSVPSDLVVAGLAFAAITDKLAASGSLLMREPDEHSQFVLTPSVLLKAYACGIFPMAESADDPFLYWVEPDLRGIMPLQDFHVPKRLGRLVRSGRFDVRIDTNFEAVIGGCAAAQPDRPKTWINDQIKSLYTALFYKGYCHCVEVYQEDQLVGGLYGVHLGAAFFGESMFSRVTDASKVALVHLVAQLKATGFCLLDTQFVTEHLSRFGAVEIPKAVYTTKLEAALARRADFNAAAAMTGRDALALSLS